MYQGMRAVRTVECFSARLAMECPNFVESHLRGNGRKSAGTRFGTVRRVVSRGERVSFCVKCVWNGMDWGCAICNNE